MTPKSVQQIWLITREFEGWAEAGGVKDVVRDQARGFAELGWAVNVILPLYGFLAARVFGEGRLVWSGRGTSGPFSGRSWEVWEVAGSQFTLKFLRIPSFEEKDGVYTYSANDEQASPSRERGAGFADGVPMNLEYQWAVTQYWFQAGIEPGIVLGHDGHSGFLPAIARTFSGYDSWFKETRFAILIHNAGPGYRQEMADTPAHRALIGLNNAVIRKALLESKLDPLVLACHYAKMATVSQNYAHELVTGENDHYSGHFGRYLREQRIELEGINNGISFDDKDPRHPDAAGIPFGFDPLDGEWRGKYLCRSVLRERLLLHPSQVYGRLVRWNNPIYFNQGRLTSQKGVDALGDLISRALEEKPDASFLVMAQGERRYEERFIWMARNAVESGRFLFINKYDDSLARLLFATSDFLLMPSEYEPCGLTDLKAQLMGALPIVHAVGGLVKVIDGVTGFTYKKNEKPGFWGAFERSLELYHHHPQRIDRMRRQAFEAVLEGSRWSRILQASYIPWLTEREGFPMV